MAKNLFVVTVNPLVKKQAGRNQLSTGGLATGEQPEK
jgi:hypothetical protein